MPLSQLTEPLGRKRAAHLLRRACFGGTKAEIDEFALLTPQEAIEWLFQEDLPDPTPPIDPETGVEWITTGNVNEDNADTLMRYFLDWTLGLMTGATAQEDTRLSEILRERIVLFLHTHFTTKRSVVRDSRSLYYQQALFRFYAFDKNDKIIPGDPLEEIPDEIIPKNFKELTLKVSIDNAMLRFLDGYLNVKGRPNENYARELLELYSIGKGLEGIEKVPQEDGDYIHFTEQDVQAGARVLSGFDIDDSYTTIDEDTGIPRGNIKGNGTIAQQHDNGDKTFSFRFENTTIAPSTELLSGGRATEESVIDEIRQMINMIYDQRETAQHICRRLYRFFVYHDVSEAVENAIVKDLADVFVANDFKIQPVLEALFTSTYFYDGVPGSDDDMFGSLIKSPVDLAIGMVRSFELPFPNYLTESVAFYELMDGILGDIIDMGMDYYEPFEVAGYSAYFQFPIFNRAWISTNYLTNRYQFIRSRINPATGIDAERINVYDYIRNTFDLSVYSDGRQLITTLISYFFPLSDNLEFVEDSNGDITNERLSYFLQEFLFKEGLSDTGEDAWTALWEEDNPGARASERLSFLFNALLQSPEFQLM